MRKSLILMSLLAAAGLSSCATAQPTRSNAATTESGHSGMDEALALAEDQTAAMQFAEAVATLSSYASVGDAKVDATLAKAYMHLAIDGRQPEEIEAAAIRPAIDHAQRAAANGSGLAMNLLYLIYGHGWGTEVDDALALAYLEQAVAAGDDGARLNYAISLYNGTSFIDWDRDRACELFEVLIKREVAMTVLTYYYGLIMFRGECGGQVDRAAGMELIQTAAEHDVRDAQRDLAMSHEYGWVGATDLARALVWYERAAGRGDAYSQWRIGMSFVRGELREPDSERAVGYFQQSAASGHPNGLTSLAVMYATGDGIERDYATAIALYTQAAQLGESHAYRALATMYARGEGVVRDLVQARLYYLQSVELGSDDSQVYRTELESGMDADQLAESDLRFAEWLASRHQADPAR